MNNHNYHGNKEPVECSECNTSMIESCDGNFLICENVQCDNEIELEGDGDE